MVRRLDVHQTPFHPRYVVWELTLACDHACKHCGSRAATARTDELTVSEALDTAAQLIEAGTREVVLIGGEAYLHEGVYAVATALRRGGVWVGMTTGGWGIDAARAQALVDAGVGQVSVSIDGLEATHDRMRAKTGSFRQALAALGHLKKAGARTSSNININRSNEGDIEALYEVLRDAGVRSWQVQLTAPLGRAADRPQMLLRPYDLLTLMPRLAALKERAHGDGIRMMLGNNLGYFGPHEGTLRSLTPDGGDHWQGCQAGRFVMGIESDGAVKGCPSLQTSHYVGGHLRDAPLRTIWEGETLAFARARTREDLWGYCRDCAYGDTCLGGCSFTAHALFGRPGNNPYCVHRARMLKREGLRERLVPADAAPGRPFDHGLFEVVTEPFDAPESDGMDVGAERARLWRITRKPSTAAVEGSS